MIEPFPLVEIEGPPRERGRQYGRQAATRIARGVEYYAEQLRPALNGTITATVAMIVMEPALGMMEVAPLPALNRRFTTYRLEIAHGAAAAVAG